MTTRRKNSVLFGVWAKGLLHGGLLAAGGLTALQTCRIHRRGIAGQR